ncbi:DUF6502 family protein [Ottowia caeni]|uniref:DUF6502 family protein n=1 Tax=Ottowia caeni TaxID=2870339 RepID=UPI001E595214|nr:DUF6502 family protein [Ottowia caeni]
MHHRLTWAQSALVRILRPAIRLALAMGLKHAHLEEILRDLLLDEAKHLWRSQGVNQPNLSQLAVTTGLNRKDVTARVRQTHDALPTTEASATAKAYTAWLQLVSDEPAFRRLPIADPGDGPSFELMARLATRGNVHHKTLLEELLRLGLVALPEDSAGGAVELVGSGFVPSGSLRDMLAFTGDNVRDHLLAAVGNTLGDQPRMLERAVYASGLSIKECERIHHLMREKWDRLHFSLVREMSEAHAKAQGQGTARMRVGVYVYHEDQATGCVVNKSIGEKDDSQNQPQK